MKPLKLIRTKFLNRRVEVCIYDKDGDYLMAIADGMGGLSKGELASATVVRAFSSWFDEKLEQHIQHWNGQIVADEINDLLLKLNEKILEYGKNHAAELGTTVTMALFVKDELIVCHVGDTRLYCINSTQTVIELQQITEDQTFIAREMKLGRMTLEQAMVHPKRNALLQCVGASSQIEPDVMLIKSKPGMYMMCSDGFRHVLTEQEIISNVMNTKGLSKEAKSALVGQMIHLVKSRGERDNISSIIIEVE